MNDQVESPSRQVVLAEANLQRQSADLTTLMRLILNPAVKTYLGDFCDFLVKKQKSLREGDGPAHRFIDHRLQHLMDHVYIDFEHALRAEFENQCDNEFELIVERDIGTLGSTRVTVRAD